MKWDTVSFSRVDEIFSSCYTSGIEHLFYADNSLTAASRHADVFQKNKKPKRCPNQDKVRISCFWWTSRDTLMNGDDSGHFFENYVVGELLRTYAYAKSSAALAFYRDKDQREIDLVIEQDGVLHPLEIKKASEPDRRAVKVFDLLKKAGRPIGPGGIVCMTDRPFPINEEYSYIPANLI